MRSQINLFFKTISFDYVRKSSLDIPASFKNTRTYCTLHKNIINRNPNTVKHVYKYWNKKFKDNNISEPSNSISYILAHVFETENVSDVFKRFSVTLNDAEIKQIQHLCELRMKRMPIQYVLGEWNFYGLILKMQPPVFISRPETEELVNIVLRHLENIKNSGKILNILEICCGSGAISLALLKSNLNIKITAIDQSIDACKLTTKNALIHKLESTLNVLKYQVTNECRLQEIKEEFDVIVTNPPYVPTAEVLKVQSEIKLYEDLLALEGGADGLSIIKPILRLANEKLVNGGKLFVEADTSHPILIKELIQNQPELSLKYVETCKDFCKKDRFVVIKKY